MKSKRLIIFCLIIISCLLFFGSVVSAQPVFKLIYVVQSGDTLSEIAEKYSVSTIDINNNNNINSNSTIRVGDELLIPLSADERKTYFNTPLFPERNSTEVGLEITNVYSVRIDPERERPDVSHISQDEIISYHVGPGDTLYDLAGEFNVSIGVIMALNNMENSVLRAGEIIKLPIHKLTPKQVLARTISSEDIELLARAIFGEARGEPFIGQVAVGAVIINRVLGDYFPNTFREVIYQHRQFSAVADGQINLTPNRRAYDAAREAVRGTDPTMGAMYFYNPRTAADQWWFRQRKHLVTIGNHSFTR